MQSLQAESTCSEPSKQTSWSFLSLVTRHPDYKWQSKPHDLKHVTCGFALFFSVFFFVLTLFAHRLVFTHWDTADPPSVTTGTQWWHVKVFFPVAQRWKWVDMINGGNSSCILRGQTKQILPATKQTGGEITHLLTDAKSSLATLRHINTPKCPRTKKKKDG